MAETPPRLENEVRAWRERLAWSQEELARRSGLSRAGVSAIETGRLAPSTVAALALAKAIGCAVEDLFRLTDAASEVDAEGSPWAWQPARTDWRYWRAEVAGKVRAYPAEPSQLGMLPHDGCFRDGSFHDHARHEPRQSLVVACCDPAAGLLAQELAVDAGVRLIVLQRSSQAALELLDRGLVHAAGIHLARTDEHGGNQAVIRERLAQRPGSPSIKEIRLLHVAGWDEGLALAPGLGRSGLKGVLNSNLRWVLREAGSAARRCLDDFLGSKLESAQRHRLAFDHRGVAEAIRGGWADAGVCLRLSSLEANLEFLSLREESYDLCFPACLAQDARLQALVRAVRSPAYRGLLGELPGYDTRRTGELERVRT